MLYCLKRVYEFTIPLKDIKRIDTLNAAIEQNSPTGSSPQLKNIIIEMEQETSGVNAPVETCFGLWSKYQIVHTLVIYSVKNASEFTEAVKEHMTQRMSTA